jgi:hypothetical protein
MKFWNIKLHFIIDLTAAPFLNSGINFAFLGEKSASQ